MTEIFTKEEQVATTQTIPVTGYRPSIKKQAKKNGLFLVMLYTVPLCCLALVLGANTIKGVPIGDFTREPVTVAGLPFYIGFISNIGILFWCATASICLFSWFMLRHLNNENLACRFLLYFGLLTTLLLVDDTFLLHDHIFLYYLPIPEKVVLLSYAILILNGLVIFRKYILQKTTFFVLLTSFFFLGMSILIDVFQPSIEVLVNEDIRIFLEDGFKLLGIVGWFGYFLVYCSHKIRKRAGATVIIRR